MRCFTFHVNPKKPLEEALTEGIQTTLSEKGRRLVFLGSKGAHCLCQIVFFDRGKMNEPAVDEAGLVHLAYPAKRTYNHKKDGVVEERERVVLKRAFRSPTKILLRINTSTSSSHKINGRWQAKGGWPIEWVKSHGFSNGQRWRDDLIVMDDQDVIMIIPAGGGRGDRMIVRNDKGVIACLPEREYYELVEAYKKEMAAAKKAHELAEEAGEAIPEEEVVETVEAGDNQDPETEKEQEFEEIEAKSSDGKVEEGKAPQTSDNAVLHTEEGETIGA